MLQTCVLLAAHVKICGQLENQKRDKENVPRSLGEDNGCFGNLTLSLPTILFDTVSFQDRFQNKARQIKTNKKQNKKTPFFGTVFHVNIRKELVLKQDVKRHPVIM